MAGSHRSKQWPSRSALWMLVTIMQILASSAIPPKTLTVVPWSMKTPGGDDLRLYRIQQPNPEPLPGDDNSDVFESDGGEWRVTVWHESERQAHIQRAPERTWWVQVEGLGVADEERGDSVVVHLSVGTIGRVSATTDPFRYSIWTPQGPVSLFLPTSTAQPGEAMTGAKGAWVASYAVSFNAFRKEPRSLDLELRLPLVALHHAWLGLPVQGEEGMSPVASARAAIGISVRALPGGPSGRGEELSSGKKGGRGLLRVGGMELDRPLEGVRQAAALPVGVVEIGFSSSEALANVGWVILACLCMCVSLTRIFCTGQYYTRKIKKWLDKASLTLVHKVRRQPANAQAGGAEADGSNVPLTQNPLFGPTSPKAGATSQVPDDVDPALFGVTPLNKGKKNKKLDQVSFPRYLPPKTALRHNNMYHVHSYF